MTFKEILELIPKLSGSNNENRYINLTELHEWLQHNFFWVDMDVVELIGRIESELTIYTIGGDD